MVGGTRDGPRISVGELSEPQSLLELEAVYTGVSVECLVSIQNHPRWGHRLLKFSEKRKKKRKKAVRLRGNKFVKFKN